MLDDQNLTRKKETKFKKAEIKSWIEYIFNPK